MISRRNLLLATAASSLSLPSFAAGKTYTPGKDISCSNRPFRRIRRRSKW